MEGLIMTAQLLLGLSILVVLHELGHFLPAKWFKTKVDKFYLFFDFLFPFPDIAKFSIFKIKKGDTEYGIGWFPLGGYVKIDGMIDENMDKDFLSRPPQPWEFRSKPAWQRLIIMIGGVTVNLILGVLIFIGIMYYYGEKYIPAKEVKYGIIAGEIASEIGLKTGDKILKINGAYYEKFSDILSPDILLGSNSSYTIQRQDSIFDLPIPANFIDKLSSKKIQMSFVEPIFPFLVGNVMPGSGAAKAGLKVKDKIVQIDESAINYFHELQAVLKLKQDKNVKIKVLRGGRLMTLTAKVSPEGKLGFQAQSLLRDSTLKYSLGESVVRGTVQAFSVVVVQARAFKKMFSGEMDVTKSLSGPIGIAQQFGSVWDWYRFWSLTGLLSMVLAFMNLLPIPALDGGHVMFLLFEMVTGRKPSDKFLEITQRVGMLLLLSLMAFAIFNDIWKLFF
ncbi:MAG: RIP metalloprotease RseP [Cytophagales bacterium]|nr:RIP metalloprotease RseP [Cytophagales bacterium]